MSSKGFVLTLDAFFAVFLAAAFMVSIQFYYSSQQPHNSEYLSKMAHDFLAAADESGDLKDAMSKPQQSAELQNLLLKLPSSVASRITVTTYEYKNGLVKEKSTAQASVRNLTGDVVAAQRAFTSPEDEEYYLSVLEASYA
ncbi:hypothetical protein HYS54_01685 [Candidatus Micrarchaeota archaeon]|nr:hypothetical protein [Candidatus Micrarchaeota archaeon]